VSGAAWEPIFNSEVCKAITVESRQSFGRAEPHKSTGIDNDVIDMVGSQSVRCRVSPDGQEFALEAYPTAHQGNKERAFEHDAYLLTAGVSPV
jgi:hypothetical protein